MELTLAVLADAANTSANGKLNVLGIFQSFNLSQVPHQHPVMYLVLMFRMSPGEKGSPITVKVVLVDEDGKFLGAPPELTVESDIEEPGIPEFPILIAIRNLIIPTWGKYRFDVLVNGLSVGGVPFSVNPAPPPPPGLEQS